MTIQLAQVVRAAAVAALLTACAKADAPVVDSTAGMSAVPAPAVDSAAMAAPASPAAAPASASGMIDPNSATKEQLVAVAGMTAAAADALIAGRPYADMLAADKALGAHLDAAARKQVYARIWKPIDLNKASDAEMMLIPGVGKKMAHEFEEYRPWTTAAQFEREIGKYVDKAEVARLRTYVALQ